ncbi:hypothetical protein HJC23_000366 [Cyclotella cryptica]|uniref:phosphoserine phosphatase n=1 Tax=Cyclotella cryptica TaxID=29204 RepID=A0ABD3NMW2_9STRA|eukprot:CCRYP_020637-RA/>CCRYP_020637-RA protein AED:0.05 eAED:0.05 QI:368/1/1/1/1/1/2/102/336
MMPSQRILRHISFLRTLPTFAAAARPPIASFSSSSSPCFVPPSSSFLRPHATSTASLSLSPPRMTGSDGTASNCRQTQQSPCCRTLSTQASAVGEDVLSHYEGMEFEGNNVGYAMEMLAKADAVCFDVDSTVIDEEGIDVLAETLGKGPEVSAWTLKAMNGNIKFEDALAARLDIIKPSRSDIAACLERHPLRLTPGVDRLVEALQKRGTHVYLVSGGFRLMIEPVAQTLGVDASNIYANTILFDNDGNYAGFDPNEPTSADQGKPKALRMIKDKYSYETMIMVGDGATDAQAKPPADAFIGFGGVVVRDAVREKACWFVRDFEMMVDIVSRFGSK